MGRFDEAAPELGPVREDETFAPDERLKRQLAYQPSPWGRPGGPRFPDGASLEERQRIHAEWLERQGLLPLDEVRNDAVTTVQYETDDWHVRWVLAEQANTVVIRSLTIEPRGRRTPPGGITSNLLRELKPAQAAAAGAPHFSAPTDEHGARNDDLAELLARFARRDVLESQLPATPPTDRTGRPRLPDAHLAAVALAYLEELPRGRGLLRRLGTRFERTPETMRDQVRLARRAGFLSNDAQVGKRGASPGPRLRELLTQPVPEEEDHDG